MATRRTAVKYTPKVIASASTYIDPLVADSTVSYKVIQGPRHLWGTVQLSDCNRKIEWYFNGRGSPDKINVAIQYLTDFREALALARIEQKKIRPKRRPVKK